MTGAMVRFLNGPAAGQALTLSRGPLLLRAVQKPDGTWDALDLLADEAAPDEQIFAYVRVRGPWVVHINRGRRSGGCGWYQLSEYAVVKEQPEDAVLRDTGTWREWALAAQQRERRVSE